MSKFDEQISGGMQSWRCRQTNGSLEAFSTCLNGQPSVAFRGDGPADFRLEEPMSSAAGASRVRTIKCPAFLS